MSFVLDASVIAKWYNQEAWSDKAVKLKDRYVKQRLRLFEPTLAVYEVCNAIRKNPQLDEHDAKEACLSVATLLRDVEETPSPNEASNVLALARSRELSYYDASYVHLANNHTAALITADEELVTKASKIVRVIHLKNL